MLILKKFILLEEYNYISSKKVTLKPLTFYKFKVQLFTNMKNNDLFYGLLIICLRIRKYFKERTMKI